jgi:hypothetical protein
MGRPLRVPVQSYRLVRTDVLVEIARRGISKIRVTGHSLGAAVATLCALDLKLNGLRLAATNAKDQIKGVRDAKEKAAKKYADMNMFALAGEHTAAKEQASLDVKALEDALDSGDAMKPDVGLYTFGSPPVGNQQFQTLVHNQLGERIFRAATATDPVTQICGPCGYHHVGRKFFLMLTNGTIIPDAKLIERRIFHAVSHSLIF